VGSQGGNVVVRDSMIANPMERTEDEMREIQEVRRCRISDVIMDEEEDEEGSIPSGTFTDVKDAESLDLSVTALTALGEIYDDSDARFKSNYIILLIGPSTTISTTKNRSIGRSFYVRAK